MKITPSPRILRMLGEIEFDEWQCVAELVDNSFDDFAEILRDGLPWPGGFKVSVTLPGPGADVGGAEVVVSDTGRGMTRDRLEQAVRAGWSSNDRFDKLGLFGMGFNVSTARLGRKTRVLTTQPGDPEWLGVEIDLDRIGEDFEADDIIEPKDDPSEHGTRVEISRLHPDRASWLQRNPQGLRATLGRVYGWLLENRPFELWVQGVKVKPRRPCRWGEDRFVVYGSGASSEQIPAYIEIDQTYQPAEACSDCGNWQVPGKGVCDLCQGENLRMRERRVHGWLGVQRHLDKRDFGIDFLRNGRKILQFDKRLFDWQNPNDPLANVDVEYPIELGASQGGRLIGEIHLDHVPVHYQKNAFEYGDRGWKAAVDYLRGIGPLQPQKATKAGYPENTSPLGRLYKGYRRNDPGKRCLIPGDGTGPIHEETRRWALKFWAGDPDYQSDERWWEAVESHEERRKRGKVEQATSGSPAHPDEAAVLEALGVSAGTATADPEQQPGDGTGQPVTQAVQGERRPAPETQQERLERYRSTSTLLPELSRDFGLPELGNLRVDTRWVANGPVMDSLGQPTPVWLAQGPGGTATAFVDAGHEAFTKLGIDPAELVLVEVAAVLKVRAESEWSHAQIAARLRAVCLPDTALDVDVISGQARELVAELRQRMADRIEEDPQRALQYLTPDELTATENAMIANGETELTTSIGDDGRFLLYVPPLFLVKLLESWPEAFLDGRVFVGLYSSLTSQSARRLSLARVVGYLNDVATLLSFQTEPGPLQLQRTRLSLQLLLGELAADT